MQSLKLAPVCIFALVLTRSEIASKQEIVLERGIID